MLFGDCSCLLPATYAQVWSFALCLLCSCEQSETKNAKNHLKILRLINLKANLKNLINFYCL
nr:hypothetical protein [Campylobacter sp.]